VFIVVVLLLISLSTQSGNFWLQPDMSKSVYRQNHWGYFYLYAIFVQGSCSARTMGRSLLFFWIFHLRFYSTSLTPGNLH